MSSTPLGVFYCMRDAFIKSRTPHPRRRPDSAGGDAQAGATYSRTGRRRILFYWATWLLPAGPLGSPRLALVAKLKPKLPLLRAAAHRRLLLGTRRLLPAGPLGSHGNTGDKNESRFKPTASRPTPTRAGPSRRRRPCSFLSCASSRSSPARHRATSRRTRAVSRHGDR